MQLDRAGADALKRKRLQVESLAILLEASHDNSEARLRHCREAARTLRQLMRRLEERERSVFAPGGAGAAIIG